MTPERLSICVEGHKSFSDKEHETETKTWRTRKMIKQNNICALETGLVHPNMQKCHFLCNNNAGSFQASKRMQMYQKSGLYYLCTKKHVFWIHAIMWETVQNCHYLLKASFEYPHNALVLRWNDITLVKHIKKAGWENALRLIWKRICLLKFSSWRLYYSMSTYASTLMQ